MPHSNSVLRFPVVVEAAALITVTNDTRFSQIDVTIGEGYSLPRSQDESVTVKRLGPLAVRLISNQPAVSQITRMFVTAHLLQPFYIYYKIISLNNFETIFVIATVIFTLSAGSVNPVGTGRQNRISDYSKFPSHLYKLLNCEQKIMLLHCNKVMLILIIHVYIYFIYKIYKYTKMYKNIVRNK